MSSHAEEMDLSFAHCSSELLAILSPVGIHCAKDQSLWNRKLAKMTMKQEYEAMMVSPQFRQVFLNPIMSEKAKAKALEKLFQNNPEQAKGVVDMQKTKVWDKVWLEVREEETINLEEQRSRKERLSVFEEFESLRDKVGAVAHLLVEDKFQVLNLITVETITGSKLCKPTRKATSGASVRPGQGNTSKKTGGWENRTRKGATDRNGTGEEPEQNNGHHQEGLLGKCQHQKP